MESEIRLRLDPVRLFWYCTGSADGNQDDWLCACLSNDQQWCNTKYMKESINIPASSQEQCRRLTIKHVVASYMALDVPHSCIDLNFPAPASTHTLVRARSLWARRLGTSDQPFIFLMCKCRNLISLSILDGSQSNSGLKYMRVSSFRICCQNAVKPPFACVTACRRSSIPSMSRLMNSIGISLQQSCTCIQSWSKFVALTGS